MDQNPDASGTAAWVPGPVEAGDTVAQDRPRVSLSAIVGTVAAILGIAGVVTQVLAYLVARSFYASFGLEPTDVGITPLNAALRLSNTAANTFFELVFQAGLLCSILSGLVIAIAGVRSWYARRTGILHRELEQLDRDVAPRFAAIDKKQQIGERLAKIEDSFVYKLAHGKYRLQPFIRVLIVLQSAVYILPQVSIIYFDASLSAMQYAFELQSGDDRSAFSTPSALQLDLRPKVVLVQWKQDSELPVALLNTEVLEDLTPEKVSEMTPAQLAQLAEQMKANAGNRIFSAYELASFDGRTILWFEDNSIVVSVESSDIIVSRYGYGFNR